MDINQLHQFCLIVETGTMAEASRLLRLSAGALSRSMQKLSEEVGFSLFHPTGRTLLLTEQGQHFFQVAKQITATLETKIKQIRLEHEVKKPIRIASFEVFTTYFLSELISENFQNEEFLVLERPPGSLEQAILNNEADYGITYAPVVHKNLVFLKVSSFNMKIYRRFDRFNDCVLDALPFAIPITDLGVNLHKIDSLDAWPKFAPSRNIKYRFQMLESLLQSCQRGLCAIFIPEFIAALVNKNSGKANLLKEFPMPPGFKPVRLEAYLVVRTEMEEDRTVKKINKCLRQICALTP